MEKKGANTKSETHVFLMISGRTNLIIRKYKAKNFKESDGDVGFGVAPQKPNKNVDKRMSETNFLKTTFSVEKQNVGNRLKRISAKS